MPIGRAQRRGERRTKVAVLFADRTDRALDLLELVEMAWHDAYGEVTPTEDVINDILILSEGNLRLLIRWARLAVEDWRDVRVEADRLRASRAAADES
ncbi:MAG TPA: hypothetical protein VEB69_03655 [Acidimicrobiia bacterium]|nr:hypothetical protein [Acidimicrobiia bacterium]